ncbi:MAG TPA: hypothetical protein DDY49_15185 [Paenibacillaceae bacterium]|nr:hypothetical protein [Paenibacillaceae bacterium]
MKKITIVFMLIFSVVLAGCGPTSSSTNNGATNNASSDKKKSTKPTDANSIINALKSAGIPVGNVNVYTEADDPNNLLGRPGQYTSKVNFVDTRVNEDSTQDIEVSNGGSVEVFVNENDAKSRYEYISNIAKSAPIFNEYDFRYGNVVLRISKKLTPTQEKEYEEALTNVLK